MENDIKQRAEQLKKNAEAKIQKAQLKEQKYQQVLEFQKQNNPNFRDYDKEPLIIQSYEAFLFLTIFPITIFLGSCCYFVFKKFFGNNSIINIQEFIVVSLFFLGYILIIYIIHKLKFKNHKIKFTNNYIEFYDNEKLKRQCEILENEIAKLFSITHSGKRTKIEMDDIFLILAFILFATIKDGLLILLFFYFGNILMKFLFYMLSNKSLKGFTIFPFIRIARPTIKLFFHNISEFFIFPEKHFIIYLYSNNVYLEVKKYFLQKNINIDKLSKRYKLI